MCVVDDGDCDLVTEMLNCVGLVEEMPEDLMDAATGLSGNGPAYVRHYVSADACKSPEPTRQRQRHWWRPGRVDGILWHSQGGHSSPKL